ncbi:hypothetical protein LZ554_009531 [Drepanopeziza brunnea f. sp. 'monogermtubi']|nr:hypothetical protein LZ554_009531 [Drepanopeziza brunnea f. sp. 'monogermtubi']
MIQTTGIGAEMEDMDKGGIDGIDPKKGSGISLVGTQDVVDPQPIDNIPGNYHQHQKPRRPSSISISTTRRKSSIPSKAPRQVTRTAPMIQMIQMMTYEGEDEEVDPQVDPQVDLDSVVGIPKATNSPRDMPRATDSNEVKP